MSQLTYTTDDAQADTLRANPRGLSQADLSALMRRVVDRTCRDDKDREVLALAANAIKAATKDHGLSLICAGPEIFHDVLISCCERYAMTRAWKALSLIKRGNEL